MKKTITLSTMLLLFSLVAEAQTSKWFVTFGSGYSFGGPSSSLRNKMVKEGWNHKGEGMALFFSWSEDYPIKTMYLPFLLSVGKKLKENKKVFLTAGLADKGVVEGFKKEGDAYLLFIGGSYGRSISVEYNVWQLTGGYQYSFPNTRLKLGYGPSLLFLNSKATHADSSVKKQNSLVPGVVGNVRFPLGRERRLIGVELFAQGTLAARAKVEDFTKANSLDKVNLSMSNLTLGLAMAVRR